jgi:hypothetical protein
MYAKVRLMSSPIPRDFSPPKTAISGNDGKLDWRMRKKLATAVLSGTLQSFLQSQKLQIGNTVSDIMSTGHQYRGI